MRGLFRLKRILLGTIALAVVSAESASAAAPATLQIVIDQFAFARPTVSATVGDTIEWVNNDIVDHSSTDRKKAWDVTMAPGKTARVVMKAAGTFEYYCRFHPNMTGRLVVAAPKK